MSYLLAKIRLILLNIFAFIFTLAITILYFIFKILVQLPLPTSSYILKDFSHSLSCCCGRTSLQKSLFLIINSTLSLLSALAIANYCQKMLGIVEWTSHSIHMVFLNLVFPKFPEPFTYTPSWIVHVYLAFGYLGISSQLSLTLDLMYMYNLPAIYIYKLLAYLYSKLLSFIKICIEIIEYDESRWLTCPYSFLCFTKNINKLLALGSIIIMGQVLLIAGFYYLWLTIVILMLILAMNFVKNILQLLYRLSELFLIVKGYHLQEGQKEFLSQQHSQKNFWLKVKMERIKKLNYQWIPLIKLKDIRDVFVGKDIIKRYAQEQANRSLKFSPSRIYESFTGNHNE